MSKTTAKTSKAKTPAKPVELTGKQRRTLRGLGHALSPVVQIGKAGLSKGVTQELHGALDAHELIKVQLLRECPIERAEAGDRIIAATGANLVQTLGNMLLLYKPNLEKPKVSLEHPAPSANVPRPDAPRSTPKTGSERRPPTRGNATRRSTRAAASERGRAVNRPHR